MAAILSLLTAWALGFLVVVAWWPRERRWRDDAALLLPVALLVGLGVTSVTFFAASLASAHPGWLAGVLDVALAAVFVWRIRRTRGTGCKPQPTGGGVPFSPLHWLLATVLVQALVIAAIVMWRSYRAEPYGGWDAWAIWNLHARVLFFGGTHWPDTLAMPQLSWTHPDYPWLVPASVARIWTWIGTDAPAGSALVSVMFALATVALLAGALARLRDRTTALLAGLLLLGTPFFLTFAPNQHADIPLGSFILATVVLVVLGKHHALAGLCAGFAAWTKNEGLLFAVLASAAIIAQLWRTGERTRIPAYLGGLAVGLLPVFAFKFALAPPNDLLAGAPLGSQLARVFDGARHLTILDGVWRDLRNFGEWTLAPYLIMVLPFIAWRSRRRLAPAEQPLPFIVLAMLAGYYAVYLLTSPNLGGHIEASLVRLLLQLWPAALLCWGLVVPADGIPETAPRNQRRTWSVFLAANTFAGLGLVLILSAQPAADELTRGGRGGVSARVLLGEGWFGVERHQRDRWAWSPGNSALLVEPRRRADAPLPTLKFALRSLGPRRVTIRLGERVLWQRTVGDEFVEVSLAGLPAATAATILEFSTDTPGVREAPDAGARALAFAVYNPRFD